jgi:phage recombination protein Bet
MKATDETTTTLPMVVGTDEKAVVPSASAHLTAGQVLAGLQTVRAVLAPDLTDEELRLFALVATRCGLDPFAKQIYAVKRQGRVTFQTGIDGYRSIAARTGLYDGQDEPEFGPACGCGGDRPAGHPEYAVVRVYRKGVGRPIAATAFWHESKPDAGMSGRQDTIWVRMPRVMLAKVAEALALRKAFPYDPQNRMGIGSDLYSADEMAQADRPGPAAVASTGTARERLAARRAALEATAASIATTTEVVADAEDANLPARGLTRAAFMELVTAAGIERATIAAAAGELFPGLASRHYTGAQWDAVAERLGLSRDKPPEAVEDGSTAPATVSGD